MIKAVIFDLDNTLVDFMRMKTEAVRAAVDAMVDAGLDLSLEDTYSSIMLIYKSEGIEYQEVFDHFLKDHYGQIDHKILAAAVVAYRKAREAKLVLYPHVTSTLTRLAKQGIQLAVLTDAPPKQAWLRLCYLNLHHLFDTVITFADTGELKPSPKPFRLVLKTLNVKESEALMVGDWPERDLAGARNVGIKSVFARYGDPRRVKESGADYEIDDIKEILAVLDLIAASE